MYPGGIKRSSDLGNLLVFVLFFACTAFVAWSLFSALGKAKPSVDLGALLRDKGGQSSRVAIADDTPSVPDTAAVVLSDEQAQPPEESAAAQPAPTTMVVGNTGNDGVYIRRSPRLQDRLRAWPDRTKMEVVGPDVEASGLNWKQVRDPAGNVGYVPAQYLVPDQ